MVLSVRFDISMADLKEALARRVSSDVPASSEVLEQLGEQLGYERSVVNSIVELWFANEWISVSYGNDFQGITVFPGEVLIATAVGLPSILEFSPKRVRDEVIELLSDLMLQVDQAASDGKVDESASLHEALELTLKIKSGPEEREALVHWLNDKGIARIDVDPDGSGGFAAFRIRSITDDGRRILREISGRTKKFEDFANEYLAVHFAGGKELPEGLQRYRIKVEDAGTREVDLPGLASMVEHRNSILLGPPGSGKTTTLWMCAQYWSTLISNGISAPVPLLVRASDLINAASQERRPNLDSPSSLRLLLDRVYQYPEGFWPFVEELGLSVTILVDGLDEVRSEFDRSALGRILHLISSEFSTLVISRTEAYDNLLDSINPLVLEILGRALGEQQNTGLSGPVSSVRELVDIERDRGPSDEEIRDVQRSVEELVRQANNCLEDRAWENCPDIEIDVERSLRSISEELYPSVDRTPNTATVQTYASRLSQYLLDLEQVGDNEEINVDFVDELTQFSSILAQAEDPTDIDASLDAVDWMADHLDLPEKPPESFGDTDGSWEVVRQEALAAPHQVVASSTGWIDAANKYSTLLVNGGALGSWIGATIAFGLRPSTAFVVGGPIVGMIAVVIAAILALIRANTKRKGPG